MNVGMIVRKLATKGGTQRQALSLAKELRRMGHDVVLYTFLYDKNACFPDLLEGVRVVVEPFPGNQRAGMGAITSLISENRAAKRLAARVDARTDILNPHDQVSYKVAHYFKKKVKNIPSVWMMNDMPTRMWMYWRESQFNPNLYLSPLKKIAYKLIDFFDTTRFIRSQDTIVVLDNWNKGFVRKYFRKEPTVIRSGLDGERFLFKEHTPPQQEIRLLVNGVFFVHRRFEDVIEAAHLLRKEGMDARLTIVGDYMNDQKYYRKLLDKVAGYNLGSVIRFTGKVSDDELAEAYRSHHIFVFSNDCQTWGLAVFEAMASGIPSIVSRGAGAHEVLQNGKEAILVPPRSPEAIASAVRKLAQDPQLYKSISDEGRRFVSSSISWKKYASAMEELFLKLLDRNEAR